MGLLSDAGSGPLTGSVSLTGESSESHGWTVRGSRVCSRFVPEWRELVQGLRRRALNRCPQSQRPCILLVVRLRPLLVSDLLQSRCGSAWSAYPASVSSLRRYCRLRQVELAFEDSAVLDTTRRNPRMSPRMSPRSVVKRRLRVRCQLLVVTLVVQVRWWSYGWLTPSVSWIPS